MYPRTKGTRLETKPGYFRSTVKTNTPVFAPQLNPPCTPCPHRASTAHWAETYPHGNYAGSTIGLCFQFVLHLRQSLVDQDETRMERMYSATIGQDEREEARGGCVLFRYQQRSACVFKNGSYDLAGAGIGRSKKKQGGPPDRPAEVDAVACPGLDPEAHPEDFALSRRH